MTYKVTVEKRRGLILAVSGFEPASWQHTQGLVGKKRKSDVEGGKNEGQGKFTSSSHYIYARAVHANSRASCGVASGLSWWMTPDESSQTQTGVSLVLGN
jgi:hypothetical protein